MGLFLQAAVLPDCKEDAAKQAIAKAEETLGLEIVAEECRFHAFSNGTAVLFNEGCCGYEELARGLSEKLESPVLLLYIYDEDFWGYYLYEKGRVLDRFNPMPDYFEEVSQHEMERQSGNSKVISEIFHVKEEAVSEYLRPWNSERLEDIETKAYGDDEFGQCDCWQMADFMRTLGYPYEW